MDWNAYPVLILVVLLPPPPLQICAGMTQYLICTSRMLAFYVGLRGAAALLNCNVCELLHEMFLVSDSGIF